MDSLKPSSTTSLSRHRKDFSKRYKAEPIVDFLAVKNSSIEYYEILSSDTKFQEKDKKMSSSEKLDHFFQQLTSTLLVHKGRNKKFSFNIDAQLLTHSFFEKFVSTVEQISQRLHIPLRILYSQINIEILEKTSLLKPSGQVLKKLLQKNVTFSIDDVDEEKSCENIRKILERNIPHTLKIDKGSLWDWTEYDPEKGNISCLSDEKLEFFFDRLKNYYGNKLTRISGIVIEGVEQELEQIISQVIQEITMNISSGVVHSQQDSFKNNFFIYLQGYLFSKKCK